MQAHKNWVQCVSWSPDAAMVVSGDQNGVLWLWQPKTGEPIGSCRGTTVHTPAHSPVTTSRLLMRCMALAPGAAALTGMHDSCFEAVYKGGCCPC